MEAIKIIDVNNEGVLLHMEGRLDEAISKYHQVLEKDPLNATTLNNIGFVLMQKGQLDEAQKHLSKSIELNPDSDNANLNLGNLKIAKGQIEEGVKLIEKSLQINKENELGWESYAKVFTSLNQHEDATYAWHQAYALKPQNPYYQIEFSKSLIITNRIPQGIALLRKVVKSNPEHVDAWIQLGVAHFTRKDHGLAKDYLTKALGLMPEAINARYYLALNFLATDNVAKAIKEYQRILMIDPNHTTVKIDLAILFISIKQHEKAEELLKEVLEKEKEHLKATYYFGLLLIEKGESVQGGEVLKKLAGKGQSKFSQLANKYLNQVQ